MSAEELVPPVDVDTAVSHRCMPCMPFLCWRYDPDAKAFPTWVLEYLTVQPNGEVMFNAPENGPTIKLDAGDWVVQFDAEEQLVTVYPAAVFDVHFKCVFQ